MNTTTTPNQKYRATERGHIATLLSRARRRARDEGLPFDLDLDYVLSLPRSHCPALGMPLAWCSGSGYRADDAPSLDKLVPHLGYVRGNVAWLSWRANRLKNDGTADELTKIADWMRSA